MTMQEAQRVDWFNFRDWLPGPWRRGLVDEEELEDDEWVRDYTESQKPRPEEYQEMRLAAPVRYAPARAAWTTQEPSKPGVYWVRFSPQHPGRIVDVYYKERRLMASWDGIPEFVVAGCGFQFGDHMILEPE